MYTQMTCSRGSGLRTLRASAINRFRSASTSPGCSHNRQQCQADAIQPVKVRASEAEAGPLVATLRGRRRRRARRSYASLGAVRRPVIGPHEGELEIRFLHERLGISAEGAILFRRGTMMPQPATRSNRQNCDPQRFCTTPPRSRLRAGPVDLAIAARSGQPPRQPTHRTYPSMQLDVRVQAVSNRHNAERRADQPTVYASRRHHFGPVFRQQRCQQLYFLGLLFRGRLRRR
jgi:hypothetical protein